MTVFTDIFAYDPSTIVFMAGSAVLLAVLGIAAARMNRVPSHVRALELAPAFGL